MRTVQQITCETRKSSLRDLLTLIVPSANSVSPLKIATANQLIHATQKKFYSVLIFVTACRRQGSSSEVEALTLLWNVLKWFPDVFRGEFYDFKNKQNPIEGLFHLRKILH